MVETTGETRRFVEPLLPANGEQQHGRLNDHGHDVSLAAGFPSVLASGMIFRHDGTAGFGRALNLAAIVATAMMGNRRPRGWPTGRQTPRARR